MKNIFIFVCIFLLVCVCVCFYIELLLKTEVVTMKSPSGTELCIMTLQCCGHHYVGSFKPENV